MRGYPVEFILDGSRLLARFASGEAVLVAEGDFSGPVGEIARCLAEEGFISQTAGRYRWRYRYYKDRHKVFFYSKPSVPEQSEE